MQALDPNPKLEIVFACDASGDPNSSRASLTRDIEILQFDHDITHPDTTTHDFREKIWLVNPHPRLPSQGKARLSRQAAIKPLHLKERAAAAGLQLQNKTTKTSTSTTTLTFRVHSPARRFHMIRLCYLKANDRCPASVISLSG